MSEDFSKYPTSLGDAKCAKSGLARDRSVRDTLIAMLRDIDSGVHVPQYVVICWARKCEDGSVESGQKFGGDANSMEYTGMLSRALYRSHL